ncbi:MAG: glycosyltransferase family 2 protein, partial [Lachnospiraceae bacterium]
DGPRNEEEEILVKKCREEVESNITWNCQIVKNYADKNRGIYDRIGQGAKWVFTMEEKAIFLEDDNLPEITFFEYCKELLVKYENDERIMWVNGTNYLTEFIPEDNSSYMFTKHLLPCGWASWSEKFSKYYDGELSMFDNYYKKQLKYTYENKSLFKQQFQSIASTKYKMEHNKQASWDFQMAFSLRINGMYGISPSKNLIKNIGVDIYSEHGGNSFNSEMTRRFCGMESKPIQFPLKHPKIVLADHTYEMKIGKIILWPLRGRIMLKIGNVLKKILKINKYDSLSTILKERKSKRI